MAPHVSYPLVIQVDVSGFTRLSESYAANGGTGGCEDFSLLMSGFLARMCSIIQSHGGDIDCFAGDALLVVFSGVPTGATAAHAHPLASDVQAAVTCALDVSNQLNGYQPSAEHPALGIHAGLSCGTIFAVECGAYARRSEDDSSSCVLNRIGTVYVASLCLLSANCHFLARCANYANYAAGGYSAYN